MSVHVSLFFLHSVLSPELNAIPVTPQVVLPVTIYCDLFMKPTPAPPSLSNIAGCLENVLDLRKVENGKIAVYV